MKNTGSKLLPLLLTVIIFIGVGIFIFIMFSNTNKETKIILKDTYMEIHAQYGINVDYNDITTIELKDTVPSMKKTNGASLGEVKKGNFDVSGYGASKVYIMSKDGPFLFIKTNKYYVIINFKDETKTQQLYNDLNDKINK